MARGKKARTLREAEEITAELTGARVSYTAIVVTQGNSRFFTLAMPSDVLAETCTVDTQADDRERGFQRRLDVKRADEIADYIDNRGGTIPGAIVLSAQPSAALEYNSPNRTLRFRKHPSAFLILDGQHRVFGFQRAEARLRVPVVIYNNLTKSQEAKLFMDINTKQRPVPNELLLAIKRLAQTETSQEAVLRDIFDKFESNESSPLAGMLSSAERKKGKISRVTFNAALRPIFTTFEDSNAEHAYQVLRAYIHAWMSGIRSRELDHKITNPTLLKAIMLLFPAVAEKVSDRYGDDFSSDNFDEVIRPVIARVKKTDFASPGNSPSALYDTFRRQLESGFSIGRARRA